MHSVARWFALALLACLATSCGSGDGSWGSGEEADPSIGGTYTGPLQGQVTRLDCPMDMLFGNITAS